MNSFQTAESGFAILKHFMSIMAVLSQSLLLCWLGERHIQQVCATPASLIVFIASHRRLHIPNPHNSEANLETFSAESAS
jgi:hypothetical protein